MDRRSLLKSVAAVPLLAAGVTALDAAPAAALSQQQKPQLIPQIKARKLSEGMTLGLVSPASNVAEDENIRFAVDVLNSLGFKVKKGAHLHARNQYFAGTDQQRAEDLNTLFADPQVDGIFTLRGGFGSSRLLPLLDYDAIAANPKVLLGYSDITALLNAIHKRTGLITFHGPIAAQNFTDYSYGAFRRTLMEAGQQTLAAPPTFDGAPGRVEKENRLTTITGGVAQGRLVGGNLTMISHLLGTPYAPDFAGRILFLEEIGEAPYRIDRMLTQLSLAGALQQVAGIVFGKFTNADTDDNTFSVEQVLRDHSQDLGIPVLRGLMIGHIDDQAIIPVGALARLDASVGELSLLEPCLI